MNEIINKFLLGRDKFMPEVPLKQLGFTYSACGLLIKNKEIIQKIKTGNTDYIFRNDRDIACFQHDMDFGKYKDLAKRTESDEVLKNKSLKIAIKPKYDGLKRTSVNGLQVS